MSRNHMHFAKGYNFQNDSTDSSNQVISGMRNTCEIYIEIDPVLALRSGIAIYESYNGVILTEGYQGNLPVCFFKDVYVRADKLEKYKEMIGETLFDLENKDMKPNTDPYLAGPLLDISHIDTNKKLNNQKILVMKNRFSPNLINYFSKKYFFILDFEANCIEGASMNPQEIIEFPVVPVNTLTREIETDKIFHTYVKPEHYAITKFCTELTGITQETVDKGIKLSDAIQAFEKHIVSLGISEDDFVFVTCGEWDFKTCLKKEAGFKGMKLPRYLKRYINIKKIFGCITQKFHKIGMVEMLDHFKLKLEGKHHSGIDDSKNIAKILIELLNKGGIIPHIFITELP